MHYKPLPTVLTSTSWCSAKTSPRSNTALILAVLLVLSTWMAEPRFDDRGRIYQAVCAGCGGNDDLPTTPGAFSQTNNSSNCNLGVIKLDFETGIEAIADA